MKTANKLQGRKRIMFEILYRPKDRPGMTVTESGFEAAILGRMKDLAKQRQDATVMQVVPVKYVAEKGDIQQEIEASVLSDWGEQETRQVAGVVKDGRWQLEVMFVEGRERRSRFETLKGVEE